MYDKTVRRRRVVLGLLVASSLILLTAYFGESAGGGLHSVQRGVLDVISPIQEGTSKALKPVRDLFGWTGDTLDAKGQLKDLRKENSALRQQNIDLQSRVRDDAQLRAQAKLNDGPAQLNDNAPVHARVSGVDPNLWFDQVTIDKGTSSGIRTNQAVVTGQGLVGKVTFAWGSGATVTLITNHDTELGGTVMETGVKGLVGVDNGHPTSLVLSSLASQDVVKAGDTVVTSGTVSKVGRYQSPYPRNIPIGRVTHVDNPGQDDQEAHVAPFANLRRLDLVEVLTKGDAAP
ncbi:MAG TPA: rod shape-determining protein MreC [Solirubrobacteraceae bacterium]